MTNKEKNYNSDVMDVHDAIEYFGVNEILNSINPIDIAEYCDNTILGYIADEDLLNAMSFPENVLDKVDESEIIQHLENKNYTVIDNEDEKQNDILKRLKTICREIQPRGYIGKEEAKNILCQYLDDWMIKYF